MLGVPTGLDRLLQQAIHQGLGPIYEPTFSECSDECRPGKSAQQAVRQAKRYQPEGKRWVVDMDLAKFFDEVKHDKLLSTRSHRIKDQRSGTWKAKQLLLFEAYGEGGREIKTTKTIAFTLATPPCAGPRADAPGQPGA